jgi:WD40 repeat protein
MSLVLATGSYDYTIKFWDPSASGSTEEIRYATNSKIIVNKLEISEDKSKLAAGFSNCAKIYDINKNNAVFSSF